MKAKECRGKGEGSSAGGSEPPPSMIENPRPRSAMKSDTLTFRVLHLHCHDSPVEDPPRDRFRTGDRMGAMTTRFRYALDPLGLLASTLYAGNRWGWKGHTHSTFLHGYFNDFLLIPCALPVVLLLQRWSGLRRHDDRPDASEICLHLVIWSVAAELIAPLFFPVTADPQDLLAYAAGAALSWGWWNVRRVPEPLPDTALREGSRIASSFPARKDGGCRRTRCRPEPAGCRCYPRQGDDGLSP